MHATRSLIPILIAVAVVAFALYWLWRASRAPLPAGTVEFDPRPSNELHALVEAAIDMAVTVAISSGQDLIPASIAENGGPRARAHAAYLDAPGGGEAVTPREYEASVELGFKHLAGQDDERAVLAYSGRVQHGNVQTDAIIVEAYERGFPVTFRYAQPYRIDHVQSSGTLSGKPYRLPDGPPHFKRSPEPVARTG